MFNLIAKLIFIWKKPKIIIVIGNNNSAAIQAVFKVINQNCRMNPIPWIHFLRSFGSARLKIKKIKEKIPGILDILKNDVLILDAGLKINLYQKLVEKSRSLILIIVNESIIDFNNKNFSEKNQQIQKLKELVKALNSSCYLIFNYDIEEIREIKKQFNVLTLSFGFKKGADFQAIAFNANSAENKNISHKTNPKETNFKLIYKGNVVPVWLKNLSKKQDIYNALPAAAVGTIMNINLVDISQRLSS